MMHLPPYVVYSLIDPAVDVPAMGQRACQKYLADPESNEARIVSGARPTRYHVRPLTVHERNWVREAPSDAARWLRAFSVGVTQADDLVDISGRRHNGASAPTDKLRLGPSEVSLWGYEELSLFVPLAIDEVGSHIWRRAELGKASELRFPLPDMYLRTLAARLSQSVAASAETLPTSNGAAEATGAPPSSENGGGRVIDVPATAEATASSHGDAIPSPTG